MKKPTYKIKKANDNPYSIEIEKSNITADFTLGEMKGEQESLAKYIKEWQGQAKLEKDKMANIEHHHPAILTMSEEDLHTAHMYYEAFKLAKLLEEKIPTFQKQLDDSYEEMELIITNLGIDGVALPGQI